MVFKITSKKPINISSSFGINGITHTILFSSKIIMLSGKIKSKLSVDTLRSRFLSSILDGAVLLARGIEVADSSAQIRV